MAQWINPLDRVPQIRSDYANHLLYGLALGAVSAAVYFFAMHASLASSWLFGTGVVLAVTAVKKIADYFMESESVAMCVGKTVITALLPFCFYLNSLI